MSNPCESPQASPGVLDRLRGAVGELEAAVGDLEPGTFDVAGAKKLADLFTRGERLCAAGKAMAARRVEEATAWKQEGHRSAAHWLARATGVSVGAASRSLSTARQIESLPQTQEAVRAGELSEAQASEIAAAASHDPNLESELLDAARSESFQGFRDRCRKAAAAARDDEAWARRLHQTRAVHTWTDQADGAWRMDVRLAPDDGAFVARALQDMTDRIFRQARAEGRREPMAAYRADALVALVRNGPCKPVEARLHVSREAVVRGFTEPGERCDLEGVGPVPVTVARHLLDDARVTFLGREGDDITSVSSPNRTIPARLRRWLEAAYPVCGVDGCAVDQRLEIDHIVPVEEGGPPPRRTSGASAPTTTSSRRTWAGTWSRPPPAPGPSSHPTPDHEDPTRHELGPRTS